MINNIKYLIFVLIFRSCIFVASSNVLDISLPNLNFCAVQLEDLYGNILISTVVPDSSINITKVIDKHRLIWNSSSSDECLDEIKVYRSYGYDRLVFIVSVINDIKHVKFYIRQGYHWEEISMNDFDSSLDALFRTRLFELKTVLDIDTFMVQRQIFSGIPAYVFTPYNIFDVVLVHHREQVIWSSSQIHKKCIRIIVHGELDKPLLLQISILHDFDLNSSKQYYPSGRLTQQFNIMKLHLANEFLRGVRLARKRNKRSRMAQRDSQNKTGEDTQKDVEESSEQPSSPQNVLPTKYLRKRKSNTSGKEDFSEENELVDLIQIDHERIQKRREYHIKKMELEQKIDNLKNQLAVNNDMLELELKLDEEEEEEEEESSESEDDCQDCDYDKPDERTTSHENKDDDADKGSHSHEDKAEQTKEKPKNKKVQKIEKILNSKYRELAKLEKRLDNINSLDLTGFYEILNAVNIKRDLLGKIKAIKFVTVQMEELLELEKYICDSEPIDWIPSPFKKTGEEDKDKETSETDTSEEDEDEDDDDNEDDDDDNDNDKDKDGTDGGNGDGRSGDTNQIEPHDSVEFADKPEEKNPKHKIIQKLERQVILKRKTLKRLYKVLRPLEDELYQHGIEEFSKIKDKIDTLNSKIERLQYSVFQFKEVIKILKKFSHNESDKQLKKVRRDKIEDLKKRKQVYSNQLAELQAELEKLEEENSDETNSGEIDGILKREMEDKKKKEIEIERKRMYRGIDSLHFDINHYKNLIKFEKEKTKGNKNAKLSKIRKYETILEARQKLLKQKEKDLLEFEARFRKSITPSSDRQYLQPPEPVKSIRKVAEYHKGRPSIFKQPQVFDLNNFRLEKVFQQPDRPRAWSSRFTVPLPYATPYIRAQQQQQQPQPQVQHIQQPYHPYQHPYQPIPEPQQQQPVLEPDVVTISISDDSDEDAVQETQTQTQPQYQPQVQHIQQPYKHGQSQPFQPYQPPQQLQQPYQLGQPQPFRPYQPQVVSQEGMTYPQQPIHPQPRYPHPQQFQSYQPYQYQPQQSTQPQYQQQLHSLESGAFTPYQHQQPEIYQPNIPQNDQPKQQTTVEESRRHLPPKKRIRIEPQPNQSEMEHVSEPEPQPNQSETETGEQEPEPQPNQSEKPEPQPNQSEMEHVSEPEPQPNQSETETGEQEPEPQPNQSETETGEQEPEPQPNQSETETGEQEPSQQSRSAPQRRTQAYTFPVPPTIPRPPASLQTPHAFENRENPSDQPPEPPIGPYPNKPSGRKQYVEEKYYKNTQLGWVRINKGQFTHLLNKYDYQKAMGLDPFDINF
uniref:Uncharacterized protein n=1 Tax=Theileria annulata TaxID=5874 RepID=A0A3B0NAK1_THEAN